MDINTIILVLVAIFSVIFGALLPFAVFTYKAWRMKKDHLKKMQSQVPMFGPIRKGTTCTDHGENHEWKSLPLAKMGQVDPNNPEPQQTLVCMKCGVLSGEDHQFYPEGLETLKRNVKMMEDEKAFVKEIEEFRKKELERRFYSFVENTVIPEDESTKHTTYKKLYDLGASSVEEIAHEISKKIQQRQQQKVTEMIRSLHENNTNL